MKLYYTNSVNQDQIQNDPRLSLGGYKALSPLPNDAFDNLFGEISQFLLSKDIPEDEYVGLVLKNETGVAVENLWLWFEFPVGSYSKFLVAAVDLVADANGVLAMEHIPTKNSKPIYADFYEANGINNAVSLGSVEIDGMLGLWISRQLIADLASLVQSDANLYTTDPNNSDLVIPVVPTKQDSISIKLVWGADYYYGADIGTDLI
jgi:hypothetical protein